MAHTYRRLSRRSLLATAAVGLGLTSLTGCRDEVTDSQQPADDPLEPVLASAVYLADRYQGAISAMPELSTQLTPLREAHKAHVLALSRELGVAEASTPPPGRPPAAESDGSTESPQNRGAVSQAPLPKARAAVLSDLRELERLGQKQAATYCMAGPGYRAELVGSIAAARGTHVEVLV